MGTLSLSHHQIQYNSKHFDLSNSSLCSRNVHCLLLLLSLPLTSKAVSTSPHLSGEILMSLNLQFEIVYTHDDFVSNNSLTLSCPLVSYLFLFCVKPIILTMAVLWWSLSFSFSSFFKIFLVDDLLLSSLYASL
jgi:hypothetical protein